MQKNITDKEWENFREEFKRLLYNKKNIKLKEFCINKGISYNSARQKIKVWEIKQELKIYNKGKNQSFIETINKKAIEDGVEVANKWLQFQKINIEIDEDIMQLLSEKVKEIKQKEIKNSKDLKELKIICLLKSEITKSIYAWLLPNDTRIIIEEEDSKEIESLIKALSSTTKRIWSGDE